MQIVEDNVCTKIQGSLGVTDLSSPSELGFAYLNLQDHPRGQLMLLRLVQSGFVPRVVIEEDSPLAEAGRTDQLKELRRVRAFAPLEQTQSYCRRRGIEHVVTHTHNDERTIGILRQGNYPLVILGDTRVLRPEVISTAGIATINVHPGVLPEVRGNTPYIWSIIHGLPQGATAHIVNAEVDRGPILHGKRLDLRQGITYPQLVFELNRLCADVLVETLAAIVERRVSVTTQPDDRRMTFRKAPEEIKRVAADMLAGR